MSIRTIWLVPAILALAFVLGTIPPAAAATTQTLNLASATVTGNLTTQTSVFGTTGLSLIQGVQTFAETTLHCEAIYNSASGLAGLGAGTGWFIGNIGGHRALYQNSPPQAPQATWYLNYCSNGYNESAQLHLQTQFYLDVSTGGGGIGGAIYIGFSKGAASSTSFPICGPALVLLPTANGQGAISTIRTAVGFAGNSAILSGSNVAVTLPNKTWYTADLWQNASSQTATVRGGGQTVTASSAFSWSVTTCGAAGLSKETGAALYLASIAQLPISYTSNIAFDNTTIGSQGGTSPGVPQRVGYATIQTTPPQKLSFLRITALIQPNRYNPSGSTYLSAASGGLCPCYVNSSSGLPLWSDATTHTTMFYNLTTWTLNVTNVPGGASVNIVLRLNSTDALTNTYISSVQIPGVLAWTSPFQQGQDNTNALFAVDWLTPLVFVMGLGAMLFTVFIYYREAFGK